MYTVYAVSVIDEEKHRHVLRSFDSLEEAKHLANRATLSNANHAYVKDSRGGTVFYLGAIDPYGPGNLPLEQCRPADLETVKMLSRRRCPEQRSPD